MYRTAVVYFDYGTTIDIVKVEGSPSYEHAMRVLTHSIVESGTSFEAEPAPKSTDHSSSSWIVATKDLLRQTLIGSLFPDPPSNSGFSQMLATLKTATESYLNSPVFFIQVSVPRNLASSYSTDIAPLSRALLDLKLTRTTPNLARASLAASLGAGLGVDTGNHGQEGNVLAVEYSSAGLMLARYIDDGKVFEERDAVFLGQLGHTSTVDEKHWELAASRLRNFIDQLNINDIVLLGDHVLDPKLVEILREVLGSEVYTRLSVSYAGQELRNCMAFVAARGMAGISVANRWHALEGCVYAGTCEGAGIVRDEL